MDAVVRIVEDIFPTYSTLDRLAIESTIRRVLEGKDLGSFKGDISVFKQRALDTAAASKPTVSKKALARVASKELDKIVSDSESTMIGLIKRFRSDDESRKISPTQFTKRMKSVLKLAYTDAYHLGTKASGLAGLSKHTSADEKRWLDSVYAQEQKYFNKFLGSLMKGESMKRAKVRVKNYSNAIRSVYEGSRVLQISDDSILYWVLQSKNPCPECRLLHRNSPYTKMTIPTTPKGGSTRCLSNCYCKIRVVKSTPSKVRQVARKNKSAKSLLTKLRNSKKNG